VIPIREHIDGAILKINFFMPPNPRGLDWLHFFTTPMGLGDNIPYNLLRELIEAAQFKISVSGYKPTQVTVQNTKFLNFQ
jgi:hypothetical protein